jgi:hypothetical protein
MIMTMVVINCSQPPNVKAQARSFYKFTWTASTSAVKYRVFYEERITNTGFTLVDNMDYLDPVIVVPKDSVNAPTLTYRVKLFNDSRYMVAGVVAVDAAGYYSLMSVSNVFQKGTIPPKPGNVTIQKE